MFQYSSAAANSIQTPASVSADADLNHNPIDQSLCSQKPNTRPSAPFSKPLMSSPPGLTFAELLANLSLDDAVHTPTPACTPTTPACTPATPTTPTRPPTAPPRTPATPAAQEPLYYIGSPGRSGYTSRWATAAHASQGVLHGHVQRVDNKPKKKSTKKAACVVYFGFDPGVHLNWPDAKAAVSGARNAIYCGYTTVREAQEVFAYAQARGWTRRNDARGPLGPSSTPHLPQYPTPSRRNDPPTHNPLHGTEDLDDTWYIVYKGIVPGVYHSLLEAMLNTFGMSNSAHESVVGRDAAFDRFENANGAAETMFAPPPAFSDLPPL